MPKSNIRKPALQWFTKKFPDDTDTTITSKFYTAQESWSKSKVWFFQIPLDLIYSKEVKKINLICENHLAGESFIFFKVPTIFLLKNLNSFEVSQTEKVIRIYLSAEAVDMFKEVRGKNKIDFKGYLI